MVPLALFGAFFIWSWFGALAEARDRVDRMVAAVNEHARRVFEVQEALLTAALSRARGLAFQQIEANADIQAFLAQIETSAPSSRSLALVRPDNAHIAVRSGDGTASTDVSTRGYFRAHQSGAPQPYFGDVLRTATSDAVGFTMSRRDTTTGLIAVSLLTLNEFLHFHESLRESPRDIASLLREDGAILVSLMEEQQRPGARLPADSIASKFMRGEISGSYIGTSPIDGIERLWAIRRVGNLPVFALYGLDLTRVQSAWLRTVLPFGALSLLASALLLMLSRQLHRAAEGQRLAELEAVFTRARADRAELIAANEERLRLFVEQTPTAIAMFDRNMRYISVSQRWVDDFRLDRSPLGRLHYDVFPEIGEAWKAGHQRCLAGAIERSDGERFERADGSVQWIRWERRPWYFPSGSIGGLLISTEDITRQWHTEEALRASEARYRAAFDLANVGKMEVDAATGRFILVNDAYCAIVGYSREELLTMGPADLVHPDDAVWDGPVVAAFFRGETDRYSAEKRFIRKDGSAIWVAITCGLVRDVNGRPKHSVGVLADINERKRAEAGLLRHTERQALLLELTSALTAARNVDELGEIVFERIAPVFEADVCFNYRLDEANNRLNLVFHRGIPPDRLEDARSLDVGEAFCGAAAANRATVIADAKRIATDPRGSFVRNLGVKAYICQPLHESNGRVIGTFSLGSTTRERFFDGEIAWFGTLANFLAQAMQRLNADSALRFSERRFRRAADAARALVYEAGVPPATTPEARAYGVEHVVGEAADGEMLDSQWWHARIHPDDLRGHLDHLKRNLDDPGCIDYCASYRVRHKDGTWRDVEDTAQILRNPDGVARRLVGTILDVTDRKRAEAELRESEATFRAMFTVSSVGKAQVDHRTGRFLRVNQAMCELTGYSEVELLSLTFSDITFAADRLFDREKIKRLISGDDRVYDVEKRYVRKDGRVIWVRVNANVIRDASGRPLRNTAIIQDITDRKRHEEHIQLLMREVNHRAKNMLTIVQAIARQTAASNPEEFVERFSHRIQALAANQDLLVENDWRGVGIDNLVRAQLDPFADLIGDRITLEGPPVGLSPAAAQAIGMALHELATNAGKYGALSNGAGRVAITWLLTQGDDARFTMTWSESGGPPVEPPSRRGFGTTVMSNAAKASLNGTVDLRYASTGVVWQLVCPATEVIEQLPHRAPPLQPTASS